MPTDHDKIITLKTFTFLHEALLKKAELESIGIRVIIQDQHMKTIQNSIRADHAD